MEPIKTIAVIEVNGRTYYFDIMPDYSFQINFDEFKHFSSTSFKEAWNKFENISINRNESIILL